MTKHELKVNMNVTKHAKERLRRKFGVSNYKNWLDNIRPSLEYVCTSAENGSEKWCTRYISVIYDPTTNSIITVYPLGEPTITDTVNKDVLSSTEEFLVNYRNESIRKVAKQLAPLYSKLGDITSRISNTRNPKILYKQLEEQDSYLSTIEDLRAKQEEIDSSIRTILMKDERKDVID